LKVLYQDISHFPAAAPTPTASASPGRHSTTARLAASHIGTGSELLTGFVDLLFNFLIAKDALVPLDLLHHPVLHRELEACSHQGQATHDSVRHVHHGRMHFVVYFFHRGIDRSCRAFST
jgi:hypothetical protein